MSRIATGLGGEVQVERVIPAAFHLSAVAEEAQGGESCGQSGSGMAFGADGDLKEVAREYHAVLIG